MYRKGAQASGKNEETHNLRFVSLAWPPPWSELVQSLESLAFLIFTLNRQAISTWREPQNLVLTSNEWVLVHPKTVLTPKLVAKRAYLD